MSPRLLRIDDPAHRAAQMLLPWWVNGTLDEEEGRAVGMHVGECARCRRDAEEMCALRDAEVPLAATAETELAWRRLQPLLHPQRTRWPALAALRDRVRDWPSSLRWVLAAQLALIVVLAVALVEAVPRAPVYRTLASAAMPMRVEGNAVIVFEPRTSEATMRAILHASGARVVDGPMQSGGWVIALPDAGFARALENLRARREVRMAVPLRVTRHR